MYTDMTTYYIYYSTIMLSIKSTNSAIYFIYSTVGTTSGSIFS